MVEVGPMLVLYHNEGYAGTSISEWEAITGVVVKVWKPVKLEDIEPQNQKCDICREPFGPSDDGNSPEEPISLRCGHIFGKDCILAWIAESLDKTTFTCPKCRETFEVPGEEAQTQKIIAQAQKIEARLKFWDFFHEKLGILRSVEEEECRKFLWQFVEEQKTEQNKKTWDLRRPLYDHLAQLFGLRFALQHRQSDCIPVQRHLCDAIFNLACYGMNDSSEEYCTESYEDQLIPWVCMEFEEIVCQQNSNFFALLTIRRAGWQPRIGPWRRAMFKKIGSDVRVYGIDRILTNRFYLWESLSDPHLSDPYARNHVFAVLNDLATLSPSYPGNARDE